MLRHDSAEYVIIHRIHGILDHYGIEHRWGEDELIKWYKKTATSLWAVFTLLKDDHIVCIDTQLSRDSVFKLADPQVFEKLEDYIRQSQSYGTEHVDNPTSG